MEVTFVYVDRKPCGEPFYVGIGNAKRVAKLGRNVWHTKITQKYPDWSRTVVASMFTWEAACDVERQLIAEFGRRDLGTGSLTNHTDGGEGVFNPSAETVAKQFAGRSRAGNKTKSLAAGIFAMTKAERVELGKRAGKNSAAANMANRTSIFAMSRAELVAAGRVGGRVAAARNKEAGVGIFGLTDEQQARRITKHRVAVDGIEYQSFTTAHRLLIGHEVSSKIRVKFKAEGSITLDGITFTIVAKAA